MKPDDIIYVKNTPENGKKDERLEAVATEINMITG